MNKISLISFLFISLALLGPAGFVFASTTQGTIDSTYKYAWSNNIGWLNFGCDQCSVSVTDSALTGYAWSPNYGWIKLNPSTSGITNNNEGTLSGYAWGENTGWINFSGVTINSAGVFTGTATGDIVGTINFNCDNCQVKTDWRPASTRGGGGGLPAGAYMTPSVPPSGFSILINDGQEITNSQVIALKLNAGTDTKRVAISNFADFRDAIQEDYQLTKTWDLCKKQEDLCQNPIEGRVFQVFAKFYTQYGQPSEIVSTSIILDTQEPSIEITDIKTSYSTEEDVILSGKTEPNSEILLYWDGKYGLAHSNNQGQWLITLGRLLAGKCQLTLFANDRAGNSGKQIAVELVIEEVAPKISAIERLKEVLLPLIPPIFRPKEVTPEPVIIVSEKAPLSLQSKWRILPSKPIEEFVLAPLPREIRALARKFPQLEKTLEEVGVGKITDIEKLKGAKLTLPGLTETVGLPTVKIEPQKFALPQGVPLAKLTRQLKEKIPSELVFARTGGELIDFNISLSITEKGKPQQQISTIVGKPLQLVVKPEQPVKAIKGYVVFKSKKTKPTSLQFPLGSMTASLLFANPVLSEPQEKPIEKEVEQALVLMEFEYIDPDGDGIYTAEINAPVVDGEYEIITVIDYEDPQLGIKETRLITVVDPEGYVYEKDGDKETRINGAIVSIYWLNPETKQYELWPAKNYQQENPQTTDVRGTYSFLVPEGHYYIKVVAPGYLIYDGKPFQVKEGSGVHYNIELKTKYWWLKIVDWKTALLIIVILLLLYNFYRDRMRTSPSARTLIR